MKVHPKGEKQVVMSYIADKNLLHKRRKLVEQAKRIAKPRKSYGEAGEIQLYNSCNPCQLGLLQAEPCCYGGSDKQVEYASRKPAVKEGKKANLL